MHLGANTSRVVARHEEREHEIPPDGRGPLYELPEEGAGANLPSAALVRRINVAELIMAQRAFV